MKRMLLTALMMIAGGCSAMNPNYVSAKSENALSLCVSKMKKLSGGPLSSQIDRAYVYIATVSAQGIWITFAHGAIGQFEPRSNDSSTPLHCAVTRKHGLRVVYLGDTFGKTYLQEPGANVILNGDLRGTTVSIFKRINGKFKYVKSQKFNTNVIKSRLQNGK